MSRRFRPALASGVALVVTASLAPFVWFALRSLDTPVDITATPPRLLPSGTIAAYRWVLVERGLLRHAWNSLLVAGTTTVLNVSIASAAAYAIARLPLPGRRVLLGAALVASMFPPIALAGPLWRILGAAGLLNHLAGLVLPYVSLTLPLAIWLLASFFRDLPPELEEAAMVDGETRLGALRRVVMPLAAPAVFTTAILVFLLSWNEFFFALLVLSSPERQTLPLAIALLSGQYTLPWGEIAAASVVATLPLVALVLAFQRRIVAGIAAGSVKG